MYCASPVGLILDQSSFVSAWFLVWTIVCMHYLWYTTCLPYRLQLNPHMHNNHGLPLLILFLLFRIYGTVLEAGTPHHYRPATNVCNYPVTVHTRNDSLRDLIKSTLHKLHKRRDHVTDNGKHIIRIYTLLDATYQPYPKDLCHKYLPGWCLHGRAWNATHELVSSKGLTVERMLADFGQPNVLPKPLMSAWQNRSFPSRRSPRRCNHQIRGPAVVFVSVWPDHYGHFNVDQLPIWSYLKQSLENPTEPFRPIFVSLTRQVLKKKQEWLQFLVPELAQHAHWVVANELVCVQGSLRVVDHGGPLRHLHPSPQ